MRVASEYDPILDSGFSAGTSSRNMYAALREPLLLAASVAPLRGYILLWADMSRQCPVRRRIRSHSITAITGFQLIYVDPTEVQPGRELASVSRSPVLLSNDGCLHHTRSLRSYLQRNTSHRWKILLLITETRI
jgi:hypothetical protein